MHDLDGLAGQVNRLNRIAVQVHLDFDHDVALPAHFNALGDFVITHGAHSVLILEAQERAQAASGGSRGRILEKVLHHPGPDLYSRRRRRRRRRHRRRRHSIPRAGLVLAHPDKVQPGDKAAAPSVVEQLLDGKGGARLLHLAQRLQRRQLDQQKGHAPDDAHHGGGEFALPQRRHLLQPVVVVQAR